MWLMKRQKGLLYGDIMTDDLASLIDHTLLRPDASAADIENLCREAMEFGFYSVCIAPHFVSAVAKMLAGSDVRITTVIGFPLGMTLTDVKAYEAMNASLLGADELDIVINIGRAKSGDWHLVRRDLLDVISATPELIHKAIIECCYLTKKEKAKAVEVCLQAGADFIKTSTGFGPKGAAVEDVRLIKEVIGQRAGIKASGGIKTFRDVIKMLKAGATRIGTSSSVEIVRGH